jgi:hypothetical protein
MTPPRDYLAYEWWFALLLLRGRPVGGIGETQQKRIDFATRSVRASGLIQARRTYVVGISLGYIN